MFKRWSTVEPFSKESRSNSTCVCTTDDRKQYHDSTLLSSAGWSEYTISRVFKIITCSGQGTCRRVESKWLAGGTLHAALLNCVFTEHLCRISLFAYSLQWHTFEEETLLFVSLNDRKTTVLLIPYGAII